MTNSTLDRIQHRIEAFVAEITAIVEDAVAVRPPRSRGVARSKAPPPRARAATSRTHRMPADRSGGKRSGSELDHLQESVLEVIQLNPGQRMEELGRLLRMPTKQLTLPVKRLIADRIVRTSGQKRATTYWPR